MKKLFKFLLLLGVMALLSYGAYLAIDYLYSSNNSSNEQQEQENSELEIKLNQLQIDLQNMVEENTSLQAQVASLEEDKSLLETTQTQLQNQIQQNETENIVLQAQIETLEAEKQSLIESGQVSQEEIDSLNNQIDTLNETISSNEAENLNLQSQVTSLTSEVESLDAEIDELNTTISSNEQSISALKVKVNKYVSIFNNTVTEITADDLDGLTFIDNSMFENCTNLKTVVLSDDITSIGDNAFKNCTNLTSISIPESVTFIGDSAFASCDNLKTITLSSTTPIELGGNTVFPSSTTNIYVPLGTKSAYISSSTYWGNLSNTLTELVTITAKVYSADSVLSLGDGWTLNGTTLSKTYEVGDTYGELPTLSDGVGTFFYGWSIKESILIEDAISSTDIVDGTVTRIYPLRLEGDSGDDGELGEEIPLPED